MPARSRARADRGDERRIRDEPYDEKAYDGSDDDERARRLPAQRRRPREALSANLAAQVGVRHVAELTGKPLSGVTSLDRAEDGWVVGVEVVEDNRIPSSTDILGVYEVEVTMDGSLMGYRRTMRYARGRGDSGGVS